MYHAIKERRGLVLQTDTHTDATRHLRTFAEEPLFTYRLFVALSKHELIRFLLDEMRHSALVDKTYGNNVVTLMEESFGYLIAARRILIACVSYQFSVYVSVVTIIESAQQQLCFLAGMLRVDMYMLAQP